jgi:glutathione S-transferase
VEEAERWGERELQPLPRRLFRHLLLVSPQARVWMGSEVMGLPGAGALQWFFMPAIAALARNSHAEEDTVRETIARLPARLDRVDALIDAGTIGGDSPNAADFQILSAVRVLSEFDDVAPMVEGRPCETAARGLFPEWSGRSRAGCRCLVERRVGRHRGHEAIAAARGSARAGPGPAPRDAPGAGVLNLGRMHQMLDGR